MKLTKQRRREVVMLPSDPEQRANLESNLEHTLNRMMTKFAPVSGWAVTGGDAVRIHTGGEYHRMLEEIEIVVWDHALRDFIACADQQPRPYVLISRKGMSNIPLSTHQLDSYKKVEASTVLEEIEAFKKRGLPYNRRGWIKRITNRNLRLVEHECLKNWRTPLTRDNSIDLYVIYTTEPRQANEQSMLVCPDIKLAMPLQEFFITTYERKAPAVNPARVYQLPIVAMQFLIEKCRIKDGPVDRYDLGILQKYIQKVKLPTPRVFPSGKSAYGGVGHPMKK